MLRNILLEPMRTSLLKWGTISRRWAKAGLAIPEGTTTVEGGFHASHWELFLPQQKRVSEVRFSQQAMCVAMTLNYHLLHRHNVPAATRQDTKMLDLAEALRAYYADKSLGAGADRVRAEAVFRKHVKELREAEGL